MGQHAKELEVQSLAQPAEIVERVGLRVDGLATLRVFIHAADDVQTRSVPKCCKMKGWE